MHNQRYHEVADVLLELEQEMRRLELWESQRPTPEQLQSTLPFAVDTLTFPQWLQFIFVERLSEIIREGRELPPVSGIAPMAEEYFKESTVAGNRVVVILDRFDRLLTTRPS